VVTVLAIGPKVSVFKLGGGRWIFKGNKNPQHAFPGGKVKPSNPCHKNERCVKEPFEV
jgi:hypothetical protein